MAPVRLGILAASPVYYQAPLYRRLEADPRVDLTVMFASNLGGGRLVSSGYGRPVDWGIDAVSGYSSVFLRRADRNPTGGSFFALRDADVVQQVLRRRFDVLWLHGYHSLTHMLAAAAQRVRGGAVAFREEQTLLTPRAAWKTLVKDVALRAMFRRAYGLYIGTENRAWFARWGVPDERLFHVPYAVDNEALQRAALDLSGERDALRRRFGVDADSGPVILTVGRLIPTKRISELISAFAAVRRSYRCNLLVVGSGPLEDELKRQVGDQGIPGVVFAGFLDQNEVREAYAAADLFALVSRQETWGVVVNEAMNFGLPIVLSSGVGSSSDLVRPDHNGVVVPKDDIDALARSLEMLVGSADLRHAYGAASRRLIENYTYGRTHAAAIEAVRAAVGEARWLRAESAAQELAA